MADHLLDILGEWPRSFVMVDADPAIVEYWRLAFGGRFLEVAEVIRAASLDGEELWRAWSTDEVPEDEVERCARWIVLQKGNFSGKPVSYNGEWSGLSGFRAEAESAIAAGWGGRATTAGTSEKVGGMWTGISGYASLSPLAIDKGFTSRVVTEALALKVVAMRQGSGEAVSMDLSVEMPDFQPGDLVLMDPPYRSTTGYGKCKLDRELVVEIALAAHGAGARVAVHEAEPIVTGGPWRHVELERRHGANQRTWSKQKREVLTLNFNPAGQASLW